MFQHFWPPSAFQHLLPSACLTVPLRHRVLQTLTTIVPATRLPPESLIAALTNLIVNLPTVLLSNHQIWKQVGAWDKGTV